MSLQKLITFLGLAISLVQAVPLTPSDDGIIQKVVTLMTKPDVLIDNTPQLSHLKQFMPTSPGIYDEQIHEAAALAFTSLRDVGDEHSPYILQSIAAYHSTSSPDRMAIYRDSMYSRLVDLAQANPETWKPHMLVAQEKLMLSLQNSLIHLEEAHLQPMGDVTQIRRIKEFVAKFEEKNKEAINKYYKELMEKIPKFSNDMKYLTKEQVNEALLKTNTKDDHATLITELAFQHPEGKISAPPAPRPSAIAAPQPAKAVAAAA